MLMWREMACVQYASRKLEMSRWMPCIPTLKGSVRGSEARALLQDKQELRSVTAVARRPCSNGACRQRASQGHGPCSYLELQCPLSQTG